MSDTIRDVIEERRRAIGAEKVSVSLSPGATAEGLREAFEKLRREMSVYDSFTPEERERAKFARMKRKIRQLAREARGARNGTRAEMKAALDDISGADDWFADVDVPQDLLWMTAARRRIGEALPDGAEALTDLYLARYPELADVAKNRTRLSGH